MNLNNKPVKVKQASSIANLKAVDTIIDKNETVLVKNDSNRQINVITEGQKIPEHLKVILDKVSPDLTSEQKQNLDAL